MHAYFELHIEQGPILEAEGKDIGVVTHGQGLWWLEFTLTGKEAHTGSTPMPMRRQCRARHGADHSSWCMRSRWTTSRARSARVGHVEVYPNSRNVIPGKVVFTVDIRSPDKASSTACGRGSRRKRRRSARRWASASRSSRSAISIR